MVRIHFAILSNDLGIVNNQIRLDSYTYYYNKQSIYAPIVHVHLFTKEGLVVLFSQDSRKLGPISGNVEPGESFETAGCREVYEETGLEIYDLIPTNHFFFTVSSKGKKILGRTCFAILPESFSPSAFKFNEEILGHISLSKADALSLLIQKGFPEAASGFRYILDQGY